MRFLSGLLVLVSIVFSIGCQSENTKDTNESLFTEIVLKDIAAVKAYLAGGGDVNTEATDESGWVLLHYAVYFNRLKIAELLLKSGAKPNLKIGGSDRSALFYVRSPEMVDLLLKYGADIYLKSANGRTVLSKAKQTLIRWSTNKGTGWPEQINGQKRTVSLLEEYFALPKWLIYVKTGQLNKLKAVMEKGVSLKDTDSSGNTALHLAAKSGQDTVVNYLISKNLPLAAKNKSGQTALTLVQSRKDKTAKILSCVQNKYCRSVASFEKQLAKACSEKSNIKNCKSVIKKDIHGVFMNDKINDNISKYAFNKVCKKFSYKKCLQFTKRYKNSSKISEAKQLIVKFTPKGKSLFSKSCGEKGKTASCKRFVAKYPGLIEKDKIESAFLYLGQKCRLKEAGWFYQSSQCRSGLAHGVGQAVNKSKNLSFKGRFVNGQRVKGEILYGGQPMFDGTLLNGRPNGVGICFYKNEPEECKFYKGKRVDAIYKQRLANIEQQEKMDAKLAEMKQIQKQQSDQISQIKGQVNAAGQHSAGPSVGQQIGDYAMRKAGEKVMDKLFDKLF